MGDHVTQREDKLRMTLYSTRNATRRLIAISSRAISLTHAPHLVNHTTYLNSVRIAQLRVACSLTIGCLSIFFFCTSPTVVTTTDVVVIATHNIIGTCTKDLSSCPSAGLTSSRVGRSVGRSIVGGIIRAFCPRTSCHNDNGNIVHQHSYVVRTDEIQYFCNV
jgi:hypothetical protein